MAYTDYIDPGNSGGSVPTPDTQCRSVMGFATPLLTFCKFLRSSNVPVGVANPRPASVDRQHAIHHYLDGRGGFAVAKLPELQPLAVNSIKPES